MRKNNIYLDSLLMVIASASLVYFIMLLRKISFSYLILIYPILSFIFFIYAIVEIKHKTSLLSRLPIWLHHICIILLTIALASFVLIESILIYHAQSTYQQATDYVVVLGAKVNGTTPSKSLLFRLEAAISYYTKFPSTTIIVSGGQGKGEKDSEANVMKQYLLKANIPEDKILVECQSTSTYENLTYSKRIMDANATNHYDVTIITNGFHSYRALYIGRYIGLNCHSYSAREDTVSVVHYYIREFFGVIKEWAVLR